MSSLAEIKEQIDASRRLQGPYAGLQITGGDVAGRLLAVYAARSANRELAVQSQPWDRADLQRARGKKTSPPSV